jgi:hypothetical protein
MSDIKVGYKSPPESGRIKKGERRNPNGRRGKGKKAPAASETSLKAIIERVENELVEFNGTMITKREAQVRVLFAKAMQGDVRASKMVDEMRKQAGLDKAGSAGGVLLLPASVPLEEWEAAAAAQQAQFRDAAYEGSDLDKPSGRRIASTVDEEGS